MREYEFFMDRDSFPAEIVENRCSYPTLRPNPFVPVNPTTSPRGLPFVPPMSEVSDAQSVKTQKIMRQPRISHIPYDDLVAIIAEKSGVPFTPLFSKRMFQYSLRDSSKMEYAILPHAGSLGPVHNEHFCGFILTEEDLEVCVAEPQCAIAIGLSDQNQKSAEYWFTHHSKSTHGQNNGLYCKIQSCRSSHSKILNIANAIENACRSEPR